DSNEHVRPTAATVPDRPRNANHSHGRFRTGSNGKSNRQRFQKYRAEPGTSFRTNLEKSHPNPSRCQWVPDSDGSGEPARTAPGADFRTAAKNYLSRLSGKRAWHRFIASSR